MQSQATHFIKDCCLEKGMRVQILGESLLIHPNGGSRELFEITARVGVKATMQDDGKYLIRTSPSFHPLAHIVRFMDDPDACFYDFAMHNKTVAFVFDDGNSKVDYELPIDTVIDAAQECKVITDYDNTEVWDQGDERARNKINWLNDWVEFNKASTGLYDVMRAAMRIEWVEHISLIGAELHRSFYNSSMENAIENPDFQRNVREMAMIIDTINQ